MTKKTQPGLETIEKILRENKPILQEQFRVKALGVFGSYVRREQNQTSDLDLLVEFSEPPGLFAFIRLEQFLSRALGVKVDLVMKDALKPGLRDRITSEVMYV